MENINRIFENYDELENECFDALVEFMLKCPNNSWNIDITLMSTDFIPYDCKRMWYSKDDSDVFVGDKAQKVYVPVTELMYGEIARILCSLPNEQMLEKFEKLHDIILNYNVEGLLGNYPYFYKECDDNVRIISINNFVGKNIKLDGLKIGGDKVSLDFILSEQFVTDLLTHLNKAIMLSSHQYKTIKSFLDLQENLSFVINQNVTIEDGDFTYNVLSIDTTDDNGFKIHGISDDNKTPIRYFHIDALTLKPNVLNGLVDYIDTLGKKQKEGIIHLLQNVFSYDNACAIADSIIGEVIGEAQEVGDMREALNNVLMCKMGLKV